MVEFRNVSKMYADGTTAVDELNLFVEKGETVVLIGPSGCGKTTTLKMTNRLEETTDGTISIGGRNIRSVNPVELRRGIGYVIQETGLMPHLTVAENIATVLNLLGWKRAKIRSRVEELLDLGGLDPAVYRYRLPSQLSGGQRQRIGVLRALAAEPEVVLMDEPFGALDPITRERLQGELVELQERLKRTIIFVTHDIDEALKLGDKVVLMRQGRIEQAGTSEELQESPANSFVESFIGENRLAQISPDGPIDTLIEDPALVISSRSTPSAAVERLVDEGWDTAQVCDSYNRWKGMVYLNDLHVAERRNKPFSWALRTRRFLVAEDSTVRHAAQLLREEMAPIPVIDSKGVLQGVITDAGLARMTIARMTRAEPTSADGHGGQKTAADSSREQSKEESA